MPGLMLNKYMPIIKSEKGYIFGTNGFFSLDENSIKVFTDIQEELLLKLVHGEVESQEYIMEVFGEELFLFFLKNGLLTPVEVDTESIYSRSRAYYFFNNMGNIQKKLENKTVLILGCGGIGTHVAWNMVVLGIGKIIIVDFDNIEESNLNRQILFDKGDLGRSKVSVLKEKLSKINPEIDIIPISKKIWSEEELESIV